MAIKKFIQSANLFDYTVTEGIIDNYYINQSGVETYNVSYYISAPIAIQPNTDYTWQFGGTIGHNAPTIGFYDSSDNLISVATHTSGLYFYFTTPNNCAYIKISVYKHSKEDAMLHTGHEVMTYVPYGVVATDWFYCKYGTETETFTTLPHEVIGDGQSNLTWSMDGNMQVSGTPTPQNPIMPQETGEKTANLFDPNSTRYHMGKGENNVIAAVSNGAMFYISATPNTQYSIKVYTNDSTFVRLYLSNTPIVQDVVTTYNEISESGTTTNPTVSITNTNYSYLWIQVGGTWYTNHGGTSLMLNVGNQALPLEPYGYKIPISFDSNTYTFYLSEPIRKKGDSADVVASIGTATRNIKKLVLNGSEDWQVEMTDNFYINTPLSGNTGKATVICSHQVSTSNSYVTGENCFISPSGRFNFTTAAITHTVSAFTQWLADQYAAGTPVTVWYVLATATTETFTAPSIPTSGTAQSFDVDTTLAPSEVSLTYHGWHEHSDEKYVGG